MPRLALATLVFLFTACSDDPATSTGDASGTGPGASTSSAASTTDDLAPTSTTPGTTGAPAPTSTSDPGTSDPGTSDPGTTDPDTSDTDSPLTSTTAPDTTGPDATTDATPDTTGPTPDPICLDPPACADVEPTATEHQLELLDGCAFALAPSDFAAGIARADALLARTGTAVTLDDVLGQLNREAVPGLSAYQAERMKNHDYVGFRWNAGDGAVDYWYPQGITGSSDARADHKVGGKRLLLVSWYHKIEREPTDPPARGVRLSLVDISDLDSIHYRHLLLVTPTGDGPDVNFAAANTKSGDALHAGGIAWVGDRLYVASTSAGFRVYDMSRIFETTASDDEAAIGIAGGKVQAHGYRYAVPEIGRYNLTADSCPLRFSAVALDRSADPPVLVTAEYMTDLTGRLARWPIDLDSTRLVENGGTVFALDAALAGQTRTQGAVTYEGVYYMSCSSQAQQWGRLYRNLPDSTSEITAWPDGPEDLYVERDLKLIWTAAEHPDKRVTLGIPMQGY
ncbi:hypothetical protein SAMN02745121_01432 [Nannocystis exedens]|uniref:Secreted protein n=1 Tax=Nannocystis exedens TaxID=54 RepID=A0A1I1V2D7_9BACT|nr:hypothetical protein [Nannocystis exedens]PCC72223.1 hypothetical protein NAEX_05302 [Nannocystis exedens]SFD76168.1 hypothetical protein SAMN02745121_01432 [Nannocystis exedens]